MNKPQPRKRAKCLKQSIGVPHFTWLACLLFIPIVANFTLLAHDYERYAVSIVVFSAQHKHDGLGLGLG